MADTAGGANPPAAAAAGGIGFNKMFVMLPVMLAARKLDSEDANTVYWLRVSYFIMQIVCSSIVLMAYVRANRSTIPDTMVYVPPAPQPFADPNAKKTYTKTSYQKHLVSTARSLLGSTFFGLVMTCGLHWYKGMVMGLAIQTIMGPFNLYENPLVRAILTGTPLEPSSQLFGESITFPTDGQVVDENGNVVLNNLVSGSARNNNKALSKETDDSKEKNSKEDDEDNNDYNDDEDDELSLEEVLLDAWDRGSTADLSKLISMLTADNVNHQTKSDRWTPLMVLSGLNCPKNLEAIRLVRNEYHADVTLVDNDGWTCLHWAAFHNNAAAASELCNEQALLQAKDKEGKTPAQIARQENNLEIAKLLEEIGKADTKKSK